MATIKCARCGEAGDQLVKPPLRTDLGKRIHESICQGCWNEWLAYQQALINHYGLDVRDREAKTFLTANMEAYLFETEEPDDIDTSQEGTISW